MNNDTLHTITDAPEQNLTLNTQGNQDPRDTRDNFYNLPQKCNQNHISQKRQQRQKLFNSCHNTPRIHSQKDHNITNIHLAHQRKKQSQKEEMNSSMGNTFYHKFYVRNNINPDLPSPGVHYYDYTGHSDMHDGTIKWHQSASTWRQENPQGIKFTRSKRFTQYKEKEAHQQVYLKYQSQLSNKKASFGHSKKGIWQLELREAQQKPGPMSYKIDREFDSVFDKQQLNRSVELENSKSNSKLGTASSFYKKKMSDTARTNFTNTIMSNTITHDFPIHTHKESTRGRSFTKAQAREANPKKIKSLASTLYNVPAPNVYSVSENIGDSKTKSSFAAKFKQINPVEANPSPHQYFIREDAQKSGRYNNVKIGSGKRSKVLGPQNDNPGPGAYNASLGTFERIVQKKGNRSFSMGK